VAVVRRGQGAGPADGAGLLQDAEAVGHASVLHYASVDDPQDVEDGDAERPAGGRVSHERAVVRPVAVLRIQTVSPATTRSSMWSSKSENARRGEAITASTPSGPAAWFGPKS
jgi:hypothetical protein